jgi:hypothetical protein
MTTTDTTTKSARLFVQNGRRTRNIEEQTAYLLAPRRWPASSLGRTVF